MKNTPLITTLLVLGTLAVPGAAQAAPSGTQYDVTVTGYQSFEQASVDAELPYRNCFDARGRLTQESVANFKSTTTMRMRIVKRRGLYWFVPVTSARGYDWDLRVDMAHKGATEVEVHPPGDCDSWVRVPPPELKNCAKVLTNMGGDMTRKAFRKTGTVGFIGGRDLPEPRNPFDGCPYGDHSLDLYKATGTIKPQVILDSVASEVVLKGKEVDPVNSYPGDMASGVTRTLVRILFKRVKPA